MRTLILVLVVTAAAISMARPPGPTPHQKEPVSQRDPFISDQDFLKEYIMPKFIMPQLLKNIPTEPLKPKHVWLNREIERLVLEDEGPINYDENFPSWIDREQGYQPMFDMSQREPQSNEDTGPLSTADPITAPPTDPEEHEEDSQHDVFKMGNSNDAGETDVFAMTPLETGFFDKYLLTAQVKSEEAEEEILEPPRQTRQNPNLGRHKSLVAANVDRFRTAFSPEDMISTDKPRLVPAIETVEPEEAIYGVVLIATVVSTLVVIIVGFGFGWYTLSKKAKAAADVDYPAYGVTGPNVDPSGDRKLAHSAHMYHYQHQKQQIIAMERNGMEQRSLSDPESEEENEEGDYTVYECPGFATTGEMEVKNPLFSDEPTPATPATSEVVKAQPKE